ncbi:hypothetical protein IAT38_001194 [Cryptococcus sp. DSM 104549]
MAYYSTYSYAAQCHTTSLGAHSSSRRVWSAPTQSIYGSLIGDYLQRPSDFCGYRGNKVEVLAQRDNEYFVKLSDGRGLEGYIPKDHIHLFYDASGRYPTNIPHISEWRAAQARERASASSYRPSTFRTFFSSSNPPAPSMPESVILNVNHKGSHAYLPIEVPRHTTLAAVKKMVKSEFGAAGKIMYREEGRNGKVGALKTISGESEWRRWFEMEGQKRTIYC